MKEKKDIQEIQRWIYINFLIIQVEYSLCFKNKILITSIVYCCVFYFILGDDNLIFYFFTISIIIANLYNFYIDFTNKKDFKNNTNLLKAKLRKIFLTNNLAWSKKVHLIEKVL